MNSRMILASVLVLTATLAQAGKRLEYTQPDGKGGSLIEIGGDGIRMSQPGEAQWMLFRNGERALYIVDDKERGYHKIDKNTANAMRQQMDAVQAQMEAQLKSMPPAQREQMRRMMPDMSAMTAGEYRVEKAGERRKVKQWDCQPVTVFKDDEPSEALCLGAPDDVGLSDAEFKLLRRMGEMMSEVASSFGAGSMAAVLESMEGIPVEHREPGSGQLKARLDKVSSPELPAEHFKLPKGYKQRDMMPDFGQ